MHDMHDNEIGTLILTVAIASRVQRDDVMTKPGPGELNRVLFSS